MATTPYVLTLPSLDSHPNRVLRNGVSAMAIVAGSSADAIAMAKSYHDGSYNATWAAASVTPVAAAADMTGWAMRLKIVSPLGVDVFDETIEAGDADVGFVKATGTLTFTAGAIADDVVKIDTTYYKFTDTVGAGAGTIGSPYLVSIGVSDTVALANLRKAINATGDAGTDYSTGLVAHATVESTASNATTLSARALVAGSAGNSISTTVTATGGADGLAWGGLVLAGGVGAASKVSAFALAMVAALNATDAIDNAAWNDGTHVLTVAGTGDALGDHQVYAWFIPKDADRTETKGITNMIASTTDGGDAGDALSITLRADTYTVPTLVALLGG